MSYHRQRVRPVNRDLGMLKLHNDGSKKLSTRLGSIICLSHSVLDSTSLAVPLQLFDAILVAALLSTACIYNKYNPSLSKSILANGKDYSVKHPLQNDGLYLLSFALRLPGREHYRSIAFLIQMACRSSF